MTGRALVCDAHARCEDRWVLPPDRHVHTEWSWDAPEGSMERTWARAVNLGLRSVAFTDHADFTPWTVLADEARLPA
jgi:histidinol phosphatase-like PHP family hydrolase